MAASHLFGILSVFKTERQESHACAFPGQLSVYCVFSEIPAGSVVLSLLAGKGAWEEGKFAEVVLVQVCLCISVEKFSFVGKDSSSLMMYVS